MLVAAHAAAGGRVQAQRRCSAQRIVHSAYRPEVAFKRFPAVNARRAPGPQWVTQRNRAAIRVHTWVFVS